MERFFSHESWGEKFYKGKELCYQSNTLQKLEKV